MTMAMHFTTGGAPALPLNLLAQAVPMLSRHELAALTERLLDRLDEIDGDNDVEHNGDELDGSNAEDDWGPVLSCPLSYTYPGCPISDGDSAVDDSGIDDREQGDIEEDRALELPYPRYGADQRAVLCEWGTAYRHD